VLFDGQRISGLATERPFRNRSRPFFEFFLSGLHTVRPSCRRFPEDHIRALHRQTSRSRRVPIILAMLIILFPRTLGRQLSPDDRASCVDAHQTDRARPASGAYARELAKGLRGTRCG